MSSRGRAPLVAALALVAVVGPARADAPGPDPAAPIPTGAATPPPTAGPPSPWAWLSDTDAPGATQKMVGWLTTWLGVSVTALGGVAGIVALTEEDAASRGCNAVRCFDPTSFGHNERARSAARMADIALVTGLGVLGVGLTVFFTAPIEGQPELGLRLGPGAGAIVGRF